MKILVVHNRYRIRGGEDSVFETETAMLRDGGHTVVTWEKSNADIPERQGFVGKIRLFLSTVWSRSSYREMRERLRTERPDVVHVHNFFPQFSPSIFWACAAEHVPVVMTLHNYRLTCLNGYLFWASERKICERCLGRSPIHGVCRRCYRDSLSASFTVAAMLSVHRLLGTWRRKVTRYIALTDFAKSKFIEAGLPGNRIVVKPNVIDIPSDLPELPPLPPDHPPHVIFIGRLSPEKGVDVLLRAWALLQSDSSAPPAELHIIGDGPERPFLETLAHSTPTHPIVFHGALPRPLALAHLRQSSLLVFPSLWYETFGLAVYEALSMGVAVAVSDSVSICRRYEEHFRISRFPIGSALGLVESIRSILGNRSHFDLFQVHPDAPLESLLSVYQESITPKPVIAIAADFPISLLENPTGANRWYYAGWLYGLYEIFREDCRYDVHWIVVERKGHDSRVFHSGNQTFHVIPSFSLRLAQATRFLIERFRFWREFRCIQPDLIHAWGTENYYGICSRCGTVPKILTIQGVLTAFCKRSQMSPFEVRQSRFERSTISSYDLVTGESPWCLDRVAELVPEASLVLMDYSVEECFFGFSRKLSTLPICLAAFGDSPRKNMDLLISAFSRPELAHVILEVAGPSPEKHTGLPKNIRVLGGVTRSQLAQRMATAWCLIHPSKADTGPTVVKEARVVGLPVILTTECGSKQYVEDGCSGFIFSPDDVDSLVKAVLRITESSETSLEMGRYGHDLCRRQLSKSAMAFRLYSLYDQVLIPH